MIVYLTLIAMVGLMIASHQHLGSPYAFIGLGYVAFCFALLGAAVLRAIGLT